MDWADDGNVYYGRAGGGIWRLPAAGGEAEQVIELDAGQHAHGPELLPGGEWLVFTMARAVTGWRSAEIVAQSLVTGERRVLVSRGREARYVPGGFLVWVRDQALMGDTFDLAQMQVGGQATVLEEDLRTSFREYTGAANYDFSRNGVLTYLTRGQGRPKVFEVHREDRPPEQLPLDQQQYGAVRYGPDDRQLAVQVLQDDSSHLVVYDLARGSELRLTTGTYNSNPVWSPDGQWLYYAVLEEGSFDIVRRRVDLSGDPEVVRATPGDEIPAAISADGEWLYFETRTGSNSDIARLSLRDGGEPELVVASPADESGATVSPDGRFVAFQSDATDSWAVYVLDLESRARTLVSNESYSPVWARSGNRLFFRGGTGDVYVAEVELTPEFTTSSLRRLLVDSGVEEYEVTRDGTGVLASSYATSYDETGAVALIQGDELHVVVGWFEELRQIFGERE